MDCYPEKIEKQMLAYYLSLNEKDKRRYAALEAKKLGFGGKSYIRKLFGCDFKTLSHGEKDLNDCEELAADRIRKKGAGRKSKLKTIKHIDEVFLEALKDHTAGNPENNEIKWTNLSRERIAELMKEKEIHISEKIVKQLLAKHGFKKRKALKTKATGQSPLQDEQFKSISRLKEEYMDSNNPVISIDTKKRVFRESL